MTKLMHIAAGGAVGAVTRYLLQGIVQPRESVFPWGTWFVNVTGCLLIGFLMAVFTGPYAIRPEYRVGIIAGVLGGYTTFSSFSWEAVQLIEQRQHSLALLYVGTSAVAGMCATLLGVRLSQWLFG